MSGINTAHAPGYNRVNILVSFAKLAKKWHPEQYSNPTAPLSVIPNQVIDAFVSANDGLSPEGITLDCNHRRLREVRICFTRDLKFRDCSPGAQRACRSERLIMPPVRGG
jgi:ribonuclease T2